jgi:hypothetical protein
MNNWSQQLEEDLIWREKELASLKAYVISIDKTSVRYQALLRAMWLLLYAHYEGFCKFTWDLYLEELENLQIQRKKCKDEFVKLSLTDSFKSFRGDISDDNIWKFSSMDFHLLLEKELKFSVKLETDSNLWPNLLKDNSLKVGLDCQLIDIHRAKLRNLVGRRNEIAHGKKNIIKNIEEYQPYEQAALEVMHELAVLVVDCLDKRLYLKESS